LALIATDQTQRRAQRALLHSFGYRVEPYECFELFLSEQRSKARCISVDLGGLGLSPADCLAEIRRNGIDVPVILVDNKVAQGNPSQATSVRTGDGGQAYLFWQPLDVELYLATLAAVTTSSTTSS
jgi:DNA-binding NtrC family response regulator